MASLNPSAISRSARDRRAERRAGRGEVAVGALLHRRSEGRGGALLQRPRERLALRFRRLRALPLGLSRLDLLAQRVTHRRERAVEVAELVSPTRFQVHVEIAGL